MNNTFLSTIQKNKMLVLMIFCVLTFAHFAYRIVNGSTIYLDKIAENILAINSNSTFVKPWIFITDFGGQEIVIGFIVVMLVAFVYYFKDRTAALLFPLIVGGSHILNSILKGLFERPRPEINTIVYEHGLSFPSGHSMTGLVCYGFVGYIIYKRCQKQSVKLQVTLFFSVLIGLIGCSRIVLGAHYFSDVISGFSAGAVYLIMTIKAYEVVKQKYPTVWPLIQKESN